MAAAATAQQPDIAYVPDFGKYQARTQFRLQHEQLEKKGLPEGFPSQMKGDLVWEGANLDKTYDWTYKLGAEDIAELETALGHFKALGKPLGFISQETFPLPKLHSALRDVSKELHFGHGFKVVRGVPVTKHSRIDNLILYLGISAHVAPVRARQDTSFQGKPADVVLTHIKDLRASSESANIGSPAYTADKQVFHTDTGDIVSLFALSTAAQGGTSRLASTWRVYNELASTRPDLVDTLAREWTGEAFGDKGVVADVRPLVYHQRETPSTPERVLLQYARRYFTGFGALPRSLKELGPISEAQAEALDALHFLGERFCVGLDFQAGDIQYVNNLAVFHARDGFTDTPERQRHLVRLWLRDPEYAWETPAPLHAKWERLYDGISEESQVVPEEPYIRSASNRSANVKAG